MQFFNVFEKNAAAAAPPPRRRRDDFFQNLPRPRRCHDDFFQNLPQPRRHCRSGGGSGSTAMDISGPDNASLTVSQYVSPFNQVLKRRKTKSFHQIKPIKFMCARKDEISFLSVSSPRLHQTTNDKITANRIFDLIHRIYDQKKFSWIYMYTGCHITFASPPLGLKG